MIVGRAIKAWVVDESRARDATPLTFAMVIYAKYLHLKMKK